MPPFVVSPAAPHELLPACRLLFATGQAEQTRNWLLAQTGTSGLFVARDAGARLRASALVQVLSGALGVALVPRGDSAAAVDAVTAGACAWVRERGVKVCQAFVAADEIADVAPLERHGFRHVTQLVFLRREVGSTFEAPVPVVRWSRWTADPTPEQLELLLATHEGTLDCPELNDSRTADEILAGFRPADPENRSWWTARDESGTPVGVLLVVGDGAGALDVSYLGLVPPARGRGYAGALIRFADRAAGLANCPALTVSVDARNAPAMKLYARHGFVEYDRREVWLAQFPAPS